MGHTALVLLVSLEWIIAIPILLLLVLVSWSMDLSRYLWRVAIGGKG